MARSPVRMAVCVLIFLAGATCQLGCGYLVHGGRQRVVIDTVPSGRAVEVDGATHTTPVTLRLKRGDDHNIIVRADGKTAQRIIYSERSLFWHLWDVLLVPIVFNIIDVASGGDSELSPTQLTIPVPE